MLKMLPLLSTSGCQDPDVLHIFGASAINSEDEICMTVFWEALKPQSRNFYILLSSLGLASVSFFLSFLFVACTLPISVEDESAIADGKWQRDRSCNFRRPKKYTSRINDQFEYLQTTTCDFQINIQININFESMINIQSISYPCHIHIISISTWADWTP